MNFPSTVFWKYILLFIYRFRPNAVKSIVQSVLNEELSGKQYDSTLSPLWSRSIADKIKHKVKGIFIIRILHAHLSQFCSNNIEFILL